MNKIFILYILLSFSVAALAQEAPKKDNSGEAEKYFRKSSFTFGLLGYDDLCARSEGERVNG